MADEAILRIVLQEMGARGRTTPSPTPPLPPTRPQQFTPPPPSAITPSEKRIEAERCRAAVDVEYAKHIEEAAQADPLLHRKHTVDVSPAVEAQKRLDAEKRRAAIEAEYAKIRPVESPFDPVAEAQKRLEADKKRAEIDAEYAKLRPPPPYDPEAESRKVREGEVKQAHVEAAYKKQYGAGPDEKTKFDHIFKAIEPLRSTVGGVLGVVGGAVVDVVAGIRKMQTEAARERRRQELLASVPYAHQHHAGQPPPPASVPPDEEKAPSSGATTAILAGRMAAARAVPTAAAVPPTTTGAVGAVGTTAGTAGVSGAAAGTTAAAVGTAAVASGPAAPVVLALAAAAVIAVVAIKAFTAAVEAADKAVERYGEYNAQIAQAQAIAEIRQTFGEMRRAQVLSSNMAKYVLARSELQQKWEDVKARFMNAVLPLLTNIVKMLEFFLPKVIEEDERQVLDPTEVILGETPEAQRARMGMAIGLGGPIGAERSVGR